MPLVDLTNENFDDQIEAHKLVILDFWAPWCAPCRGFAPIFEAAAERHPDILFARIDTETQELLASQFEVKSVPTILGVSDGTIVQIRLGALPPDKLEQFIQQVRSSSVLF